MAKTCSNCGAQWPDDLDFCPKDATPLRPTESRADLVGQVIAERYRVTRKLGEGGMGEVYLAEHVRMGLEVAVKVIAATFASNPDAIARFTREAKNVARVKHPNVCGIVDFGETADGRAYIAMEYVEGRTLSELLADGPVEPRRAGRIFAQCADALQAAHDRDIVHRDFKPDNIMIARSREGEDVVKVLDFGIAKAIGGQGSETVTGTGLIVGTPDYMSPEQAAGLDPDPRSDIYALGLVLFRMLTGTLPFQGRTPQETLSKRLVEPPMRLAQAISGPQFSPRLQDVLDRALAREREVRYASAIEFSREAVAALNELPAGAGASGKFDETFVLKSEASAKTRRLPAALPGAAIALVVVLASLWITTAKRRNPATIVDTTHGATVDLKGGAVVDKGSKSAKGAKAAKGGDSRVLKGDLRGAKETTGTGTAGPTGGVVTVTEDSRDRATSTSLTESLTVRPLPAQSDSTLRNIADLIAAGKPRTAFDQLERLHDKDPANSQIVALMERAVATEISALTRAGDFDGAIAKLREYIEHRPYLEGMTGELKPLYLARLRASAEEYRRERTEKNLRSLRTAIAEADSLTTRDAELRYDATLIAVNTVSLSFVTWFKRALDLDPSLARRDTILTLTRRALADDTLFVDRGGLEDMLGAHYLAAVRSDLVRDLRSARERSRFTAFRILRRFDPQSLTTDDLFAYHLRNLERARNVPGRDLDSAVNFVLAQNDERRRAQALAVAKAAEQSASDARGTVSAHRAWVRLTGARQMTLSVAPPSVAISGEPFASPVVVQVRDSSGRVAKVEGLEIAPGFGSRGGSVGVDVAGGRVRTDAEGQATFSSLILSYPRGSEGAGEHFVWFRATDLPDMQATTPTRLITPLTRDRDITDFTDRDQFFGIVMPAGRGVLRVTLKGVPGSTDRRRSPANVDLLVRRGALPTDEAADCRATTTTADAEKTCTINAPAAGQWFVTVRGRTSYMLRLSASAQ